MRIETNFEYRYSMIDKLFGGKLKGAAFVDMGNIWNISAGNPQPETYFKFNQLHKQIAIGTGLGFRYDVEFFVFSYVFSITIGHKLLSHQRIKIF